MIVPGEEGHDEKAPPPPYSLEDGNAVSDAFSNPLAAAEAPGPPTPPKPEGPSSPVATSPRVPPKINTKTSEPSWSSNTRLVSPWASGSSSTAAVPPGPKWRPHSAGSHPPANVRSSSDPSVHYPNIPPTPKQSYPHIEVTSSSPIDALPSPLPQPSFARAVSSSTTDLNSAYRRSRNGSTSHSPSRFSSPPPTTPAQASRKSWSFSLSSKAATSKAPLPDAKETVHAMVRDLIRPSDAPNRHPTSEDGLVMPSPHRVLKGCREACAPYSLKLWEIIQEKYIEGHTPLYWAVLSQSTGDDFNLILTLLSFSSPLSKDTISDMRQACLARADQKMFEYLRARPEWHAAFVERNTKEDLLFGSLSRPVLDTVLVTQNPQVEEQFAVDIELRAFQRRMRVIGRVDTEFIAKGRMWNLGFFAVPDKASTPATAPTWFITLALLENSVPTYVDSVLIISPISSQGERIAFPLSISSELASITSKPQKSQKKEISLTLTETDKETYEVTEAGKPLGKKGKKPEGLTLRALRDGGRYVDPTTDTLKLRWEVSTTKPEEGSNCVIC